MAIDTVLLLHTIEEAAEEAAEDGSKDPEALAKTTVTSLLSDVQGATPALRKRLEQRFVSTFLATAKQASRTAKAMSALPNAGGAIRLVKVAKPSAGALDADGNKAHAVIAANEGRVAETRDGLTIGWVPHATGVWELVSVTRGKMSRLKATFVSPTSGALSADRARFAFCLFGRKTPKSELIVFDLGKRTASRYAPPPGSIGHVGAMLSGDVVMETTRGIEWWTFGGKKLKRSATLALQRSGVSLRASRVGAGTGNVVIVWDGAELAFAARRGRDIVDLGRHPLRDVATPVVHGDLIVIGADVFRIEGLESFDIDAAPKLLGLGLSKKMA